MTEPAPKTIEAFANHRSKETSCAGDWVEIRSKEEILRTLDESGKFEGMPFMPEMLDYCGKRFRVAKRAHKGCDTINPNPFTTRHLPNSVLLDNLRCTGQAHDGCQAACAIFWKQAWLKPIDGTEARSGSAGTQRQSSACTEGDLLKATRQASSDGKIKYKCQATDFPQYTTLIRSHN